MTGYRTRLQPFEAELRRSGIVVRVGEDETLMEAIEAAGVAVPYNCRHGSCGACLTRVLEGEIHHRDGLLNYQERHAGDRMLLCVSRAKSGRLVLDL